MYVDIYLPSPVKQPEITSLKVLSQRYSNKLKHCYDKHNNQPDQLRQEFDNVSESELSSGHNGDRC